jgi:hypothetical protein
MRAVSNPTVALKYEYGVFPAASTGAMLPRVIVSNTAWYAVLRKAWLPVAIAPTPAVPRIEAELGAVPLTGPPLGVYMSWTKPIPFVAALAKKAVFLVV